MSSCMHCAARAAKVASVDSSRFILGPLLERMFWMYGLQTFAGPELEKMMRAIDAYMQACRDRAQAPQRVDVGTACEACAS